MAAAAVASASAPADPMNLFDDGMDDAMAKVGARWDDADYDDAKSPQVMLAFYKYLFPFRQLFLWLNASPVPTRLWTHREFAFTLANDAYLRYHSFATAEDMKKEVLRLNPSRFEIGPIYSAKPKDKRSVQKSAFKPLQRELIFDIDMDDYNENRTCCSEKKVCSRCWGFIAMAVKVLDRLLRDDFGFKHILWVYSGRRGIHAWISDPEAMALQDDARRAIVTYIDVMKQGKGGKFSVPRPLHPSLARAYDQVLKTGFGRVVLEDQDTFRSEENADKLLERLPENGFASALRDQWKKGGSRQSSTKKWEAVQDLGSRYKGKENIQQVLQDCVFQYTYPRIDTEVSRHVNHLLKSPFCVHPSTGRICVPLTVDDVATFQPEAVPTVGQLLRELEKVGGFKGGIDGKSTAGWEQTSLRPYVERFDRHVNELMKDVREAKKANAPKSTEF